MRRPDPAPGSGADRTALLYLFLPLLAFAPTILRGRVFFTNDLLGQFGPWWVFFRRSLASGEFPLWNPWTFGGQPFAADPQSMAFYPLLYPFLLFPVGWGLTLFLGFHLGLAAWGMDYWLKALRLESPPRVLGACLYALSGFFWVELIHLPVLAAAAWFPWFLAGIERSSLEPTARQGLRTGLAYSLLFLSGSFQVALGAIYTGSLYALFRFTGKGKAGWPSLRFWAALTWGFLPVGFLALPAGELALRCTRLREQVPYSAFNAHGSLNPADWIQAVLPTHGIPSGSDLGTLLQNLNGQGENPFQGVTLFLGPLALGFALAGLAEGSLGVGLGILALGALALGFGRHCPLHQAFCRFLPGFAWLQVPSRFSFLFALALSALAALGLGRLRAKTQPFFRNHSLARRGTGAILALTLVGPLLWLGWGFYPTGPADNFDYKANAALLEQAHPDPPPARNFLTGHLPFRVQYGLDEFRGDFPVDAAFSLGIRSATGYNPLSLEAYRILQGLPLDEFCRNLGVNFLFSDRDLGKQPGFRLVGPGPIRRYELDPPASVLRTLRINPEGFDSDLPRRMFLPDPGALKGFDFLRDKANRQDYRVEMLRPAWVAFPDMNFPGWRVRVDGIPRVLLSSDEGTRAVAVDSGSHELRFDFRPFWWPWVPLVFFVWLAVSLGVYRRNPRLS